MNERPARSTLKVAGYQRWNQLAFLHWTLPPELVQPLLPASLHVLTRDGAAWMGAVLFSMERIRPWWSPPVPGISWFLETNVRTYVRHESGKTGVWFFSLDANGRVAVEVGRRVWNLNYVLSRMTMSNAAESTTKSDSDGAARILHYTGQRRRHPAGYDVTVQIGDEQAAPAAPGTLEYFLAERYRLFTLNRQGQLLAGLVDHEPYRVKPAQVSHVRQTLLAAALNDRTAGVAENQFPVHAMFSEGVDVRVGRLRPVRD
ncbi:MAG: DUF2071 domain-containing protein [Planctomycetaceae bacterium]|nr:DUF2071 domain-containing protein [Planctomycetaceae bacterium]